VITRLGRRFAQTVLTLFLACIFSFSLTAVASAEIGDSRSLVDQQYGDFSLVQDMSNRFWTQSEWQAALRGRARAYGYIITAGDMKAMNWIEYNQQDKVVMETTIMDESIKIRDFKSNFGKLYTQLVAPDSAAFIIKAFPRDELGVMVKKPDNKFNLIRFPWTTCQTKQK